MTIDPRVEHILSGLPEIIRIGGTQWTLKLEDAVWRSEHEAYGLTVSENMSVHICYAVTLSEALNTLIHELTHVIWHDRSLPERPREERAVTAIGYGWTALLTQNPALCEVLNELATLNR